MPGNENKKSSSRSLFAVSHYSNEIVSNFIYLKPAKTESE